MLMKRIGIIAVATLFWWGCRGGNDDQRVGQLLTNQQNHGRHITTMSERVASIDERLAAIEKKVNALVAGGTITQPGETRELVVASNFASTDEYKGIMAQIDVLQQQLASVQGEFVGFLDQEKEAREREALRDRGSAFRAMGDPKELSRRLDILARNFSGKIADPTTRQQFVSDLEELKGKFSASLSPEQKREQARELIAAAMESIQDERARGWLEGQLRSLDEAPNAEQLGERVDRVLQVQKMREVGELTQKYNIPEEVVRDSGLISFGGGGLPGFGLRRGR